MELAKVIINNYRWNVVTAILSIALTVVGAVNGAELWLWPMLFAGLGIGCRFLFNGQDTAEQNLLPAILSCLLMALSLIWMYAPLLHGVVWWMPALLGWIIATFK